MILCAFAISICAYSQDFWKGEGNNYNRFYAGYTFTAGADNYTFELGWTKGINVAKHKLPILIEVGAELQGAILEAKRYNLSSGVFSDDAHYPLSVNIPVHATYQFSYKNFTASPFTGVNFNVGVYDIDASRYEMYSDYGDRFVAGWNLGMNLTYKKLFIGYRATFDFGHSSYSNLYLGLHI